MYRNCDPFVSGKINSFDKIMPYFVSERMPRFQGMTGLFVAGIFSASLSTISALLNSLAAVALEDYVKPMYSKLGCQFPDNRATLFAKILVLVNGVLCLGVSFLAESMGNLVSLCLSISSGLAGPLVGGMKNDIFFV